MLYTEQQTSLYSTKHLATWDQLQTLFLAPSIVWLLDYKNSATFQNSNVIHTLTLHFHTQSTISSLLKSYHSTYLIENTVTFHHKEQWFNVVHGK